MRFIFIFLAATLISCQQDPSYDTLIFNARIIDGTAGTSYMGMVGIKGDTITYVGLDTKAKAKSMIDAKGMAVSPGFVNMLSWATESLIIDGRSESDIRQGITLEVMGEGWSMGPQNEAMKRETEKMSAYDIKVEWNTLGEYLDYLERHGISTNVASFVGATTLRIHEMGYEDRKPTASELQRMQRLVRQAMEEGALGIGSSLIYAPAFYADTDELIALCEVASEYNGMYISHLRSEGDRWLEAIDELIRISAQAKIPAEIYHFKAAGKHNWAKLESAIAKIDSARRSGLQITTDMYNYTAGATGLDAAMPPWVQEGGYDEWSKRLKIPKIRQRVMEEMKSPGDGWENLYYGAGSANNVILSAFKSDSLRYLTGKTLQEVADLRGISPEETAIDLVIQDGSGVGAIYFLMSEENIRRQLKLPYMSFGSDAASLAPKEPFLRYNPHPRSYGNFARLLGKYVRDEQVISLEEAVYKLSALPCKNLKINKRGLLKPGYYADIVLFDPETIQDHATFDEPHQFSTGISHVWVNGVMVLEEGKHTQAYPGRVVRGPGWKNKNGNQ